MTGGQLGSIGSSVTATAPPAKLKWLELERWWNPLCSNLLHAAPKNNRIGAYNQSISFYELVAGSCTICITPVAVVDIFLRPNATRQASDVTGFGSSRLHAILATKVPQDWNYCWTKPNNETTLWVNLNPGDLLSGKDYVAILSYRIRLCGMNGTLKEPTDPVVPTTVEVQVLKSDVVVLTTSAVASTAWVTHTLRLTESEFDLLGDLHSLSLKFVASDSGGTPETETGAAISWMQIAVMIED